jgi:hypothetical protein
VPESSHSFGVFDALPAVRVKAAIDQLSTVSDALYEVLRRLEELEQAC